MQQLAAEWSNN